MRGHSLPVVILIGVAAASAAASCKDPTEVLLEVRTNVRAPQGTSFTVGSDPQRAEEAFVTTQTSDYRASDGFIGSLGVVPRRPDDALLAVKIILGVRKPPQECRPPSYDGCIVARRQVAWEPGRLLRLSIDLDENCTDVPCDALTTCSTGRCVSSKVFCAPNDDTCRLASERPGDPPGDAGGVSSDDAATSVTDGASNVPDGAADSGPDGGPVPGGEDAGGVPGELVCGSLFCTSPEFCCYTPAGNIGTCHSGIVACTDFTFYCDGPEDCPAQQDCCLKGTTTTCTKRPFCVGGGGSVVCRSSLDCQAALDSCKIPQPNGLKTCSNN